jgi:hypothetical protein
MSTTTEVETDVDKNAQSSAMNNTSMKMLAQTDKTAP